MIYLFDRQKKLQKIIPRKHLLSAIQTVELNGLYQLSVEVPLFYETKEGTQYNHKKNVEKAWFAGHYDRKKRFQLYKIHSRKVRAEAKQTLVFDGVHIFFDEAKAMGNIHDRRFRDSEMKPAADAAFNPIGWYVKDYDVTDRADITFYRDSVANARSLIIEKFGVEFDYGLTFDGRKIISKDLYIKKQLGKWTGKRFAYGSNLLSLTQEEDESEVYTAAVGRGRGEESGDGFGPRIEFTDIEWSKDGITKPLGQNYIEIPSATAEYGYYENGEIHPRIAPEVVFENTENKRLLADSTYYWLLENCVPKALWKTDVAKADVHDLGDGVGVIYKKANIIKKARVHKMENNLLDHRLSKITLGDYRHFKTDKRQQSISAQLKRNRNDTQSYITQLKNDFDVRFDAQTTAIENAYQQAVIDANAETQAAEQRMSTALSTQWSNTESAISTAKTEAVDSANAYSDDVESRLSTSISTQRTEIESAISTAKTDAISQAESDATQKTKVVQDNLDGYKEQTDTRVTNIAGDVETVTDDLQQTIRDVQKKADDARVDTIRDDLSTVETYLATTSGNLAQTKEELEQKLAEAKAELDNLEIGGRNHFKKTSRVYRLSGSPTITRHTEEAPNGFKLYGGNSDSKHSVRISHVINGNGWWTVSFWAKSNDTNSLRIDIADHNGGDLELTSEWQFYKVTRNITRYTEDIYHFVDIEDIRQGFFFFKDFKVEKGNKTTDWTPAPEDTEQKIININQELTNIEGQLQAKLNKTELDPINDKITEYGNTLTATAEDISALQTKTTLHDDNITQLSNETTANAEGLSQVLEKAEATESGLNTAKTDIQTNAGNISTLLTTTSQHGEDIETAKTDIQKQAGEISTLLTNTSRIDGEVSQAKTDIQANAGNISTLLSKNSTNEQKITTLEANYNGINTTVSDLSDWKSQKGAIYDQTADAVSTKVWSTDIESATAGMEGRNLLHGTSDEWQEVTLTTSYYKQFPHPEVKLEVGQTYTFSVIIEKVSDDEIPINVHLGTGTTSYQKDISYWRENDIAFGQKINLTRTINESDLGAHADTAIFAWRIRNEQQPTVVRFKELKLEKGNKPTVYSQAPEDFLQHTDFELRSDGFLLGTTHVGGEDFATAIVGDTAGMSMIADNVDFSNNITVQNQIKSWSIESVKADFASATIDYLTTGVIKNAMLDSEVVTADKLLVNTAMVDKFTANTAFIDDVKALSIEAAKGSFGDIVAGTADLQFIENKHLATESVDADKLLVDSALVNKLTVNTAFISDIKAMSIEAVEADISSIRTQILTSNVILSEHINASMALIDKLFSAEAYISTLTSKSAFIRDINAIEVTANSVILNTMLNRMGQVEGGLSIRRPDGAMYVNNGVPNHNLTAQRNEFRHPDVSWTGQNYATDSAYYLTYENIYLYHDSRYLAVAFALNLGAASPSSSAYVNVRVREFGGTSNVSDTRRVIAYRDRSTVYSSIVLDLGRPTYESRQFYLEFCLDSSNYTGNVAMVRTNRATQRG